MAKIGIVYFSKTHNTQQLAHAIIKGVKSIQDIQDAQDIEIIEHRIQGSEIIEGRFRNDALFERLNECDAIAFGSPTYMGNVAAQFKAFADTSADLWEAQLWADKIAIGFTSGSGLNGEQSCTLQALCTLACQHGMLWLSIDKHAHGNEGLNRMGSQIGIAAYAEEHVQSEDLATAEYLGQRLATMVQRFTS